MNPVSVLATPASDLAARSVGVDPGRIVVGLTIDGGDGGLAFGREAFDSEVFGLEIGRILALWGPSQAEQEALLRELAARAAALGYDQVIRRVASGDLAQVWALERAGFTLMDVGVTFARRLPGPLPPPAPPGMTMRRATAEDIENIIADMLEVPWGGRLDADPAYDPALVREFRARWLRNSQRGRAAQVVIAEMDGAVAGYATCVMDDATGHGDIELVGTLPRFRRRGVGRAVVHQAVAWFSSRTDYVTVKTQATNFPAAALYETAGFTLHSSDLTMRLSLPTPLEGSSEQPSEREVR